MLYEVKIYDRTGKLMNIISRAELEKRSMDYVRDQFTKRDREHIMSLQDDEQAPAMSSYSMRV
jgi:hypothetical protein